MIRRWYYIEYEVSNEFNNAFAKGWVVVNKRSMFQRPDEVAKDIVEKVHNKYPHLDNAYITQMNRL